MLLTWQVRKLRTQALGLTEQLRTAETDIQMRDAAIAAQERKIHDDRTRAKAGEAVAQPITRAKNTAEDGPLAPVARDALERLRARRAAAPGYPG
jgi:hypothetical protein